MLNYVEYPSSVKEGTETPGAFDQNGQRFYVLDRLQEQVSRIRYLLDTTVFFRNQLETCQAAGNAEAAQSAYLSLSSGRIGIANGVITPSSPAGSAAFLTRCPVTIPLTRLPSVA